jgi:hypothetical protein
MTSKDHQVVGDDLQKQFMAAGPGGAGAEAVAQVPLDHAVDRLGLRPLAVGPVRLRAGQTPTYQPPVSAGRGLVAGASGAGGDQRADEGADKACETLGIGATRARPNGIEDSSDGPKLSESARKKW